VGGERASQASTPPCFWGGGKSKLKNKENVININNTNGRHFRK
jgi:hypothetical protein